MSDERPTRGGTTTASMEVYEAFPNAERAAPGRAGLVLLFAPEFQRLDTAYAFTQPNVLIGREPPADVLVVQPAVSRSHARISWDGAAWTIHDLGARNGTLVNGAFVQQQPLHHGDCVRVGDAFFKFVSQDVEGFLPYRIDGAVFGGATTPPGLVGGHQLASIAASLERIARSPISVLVLGESGTGKEVFARQVHEWSGRAGAFRAINCAAIPPNLLESELFGYRRGAFSGADRDHVGLIRAADQGTLFLDEVGDLPLEAQAKLLRVLQTKEVLPLGATNPEQVDVRVVCATHRDLTAMQRERTFRGDLFARLNEYNVTLPPLRDRKEDLYALCLEFLRLHRRPDLRISVPYMTGVIHYDFPYNVRELEALIKRGIALSDGDELGAEHLTAEIHQAMQGYGRRAPASLPPTATPPSGASPRPPWPDSTPVPRWDAPRPAAPSVPPAAPSMPPSSSTGPAAIPAAIQQHTPSEAELRHVLAATGGNVAAVGRHYGKERMQVHRWMKKHGIDPNEYRP